jgi:hypothetical protein
MYFPTHTFADVATYASAFTNILINVTMQFAGIPSYGTISAQLMPTSSGGLAVTINVPSLTIQSNIAVAVTAGQFSFTFNGALYIGSFSANFGPCSAGSVAATGYQPGCFTCPSNTYVSLVY